MPHSDKGCYVAPERREAAVGTHGHPARPLRGMAVFHRGSAKVGSIHDALEAQRSPAVEDAAPASKAATQQLFALRRTDQIGTERAAAVKKAALAKARISRAAAEDDVHRAIATMWHR